MRSIQKQEQPLLCKSGCSFMSRVTINLVALHAVSMPANGLKRLKIMFKAAATVAVKVV